MEKQDATAILKELILIKEAENKAEGKLLKAHFYQTYETLKPVNIIKDIIKNLVSSPELKGSVVDSALGLTGGYLTKKVLFGKSDGAISKFFGFVVEMVVASNLVSNADEIRAMATVILRKIIPNYNRAETS